MQDQLRKDGGKRVALFIDSENISHRLIAEVMERLENFGEICIKKGREALASLPAKPKFLVTGGIVSKMHQFLDFFIKSDQLGMMENLGVVFGGKV